MADQVRVRRLADAEGQRLQQIVRRGRGSSVRLRRAMVLMAQLAGFELEARHADRIGTELTAESLVRFGLPDPDRLLDPPDATPGRSFDRRLPTA